MNPLLKTAAHRPELLAYMQDLYAGTQPSPMSSRDRVWGGKVVIEAQPFDKRIHISDIASLERGQKHASQALQWLCSLADKHGVALSLVPKAHGEGGLDDAQLRAWYIRHGFQPHMGSKLVREPRTALKLRPGNMRTIPINPQTTEN